MPVLYKNRIRQLCIKTQLLRKGVSLRALCLYLFCYPNLLAFVVHQEGNNLLTLRLYAIFFLHICISFNIDHTWTTVREVALLDVQSFPRAVFKDTLWVSVVTAVHNIDAVAHVLHQSKQGNYNYGERHENVRGFSKRQTVKRQNLQFKWFERWSDYMKQNFSVFVCFFKAF